MQQITHQVQPALADTCASYERRRPEQTVLYQLVAEHIETFFAQVEAETGAGLPDFVKEEFEAFLECGILVWSKYSCGLSMVVFQYTAQTFPTTNGLITASRRRLT